jgi:hypothetical protein
MKEKVELDLTNPPTLAIYTSVMEMLKEHPQYLIATSELVAGIMQAIDDKPAPVMLEPNALTAVLTFAALGIVLVGGELKKGDQAVVNWVPDKKGETH